MNIHEAYLAMDASCRIKRKIWADNRMVYFYTDDEEATCLVTVNIIVPGMSINEHWQPTPSDIAATDWEAVLE